MKKNLKKLRIQSESIRVLSGTIELTQANGAMLAGSVGCLTKNKYTTCPACPDQPTRIFCETTRC